MPETALGVTVTARIFALRPSSRPEPRPAVPGPRPVLPGWSWPSSAPVLVGIGWDDNRGLHVARCPRCTESLDSTDIGQVEDWATRHRCDPELAALLALVTTGRAA
jgi:hypothetical protein